MSPSRINVAKRKEIKKGSKEVELNLGDPVLYEEHLWEGKLDRKHEHNFKRVEQTGPITNRRWS